MFLNNKLYKQFYPLATEEDKMSLLNSNYSELLRKVKDIERMAETEYSERQSNYISKMRPTISCLGTPKHKNIVHNEYIAHKMAMDKKISFISEDIYNLKELEYNLVYKEFEKITVEELNRILRYDNIMKHKNICIIILGIILFSVFLFVNY